MQLVLFGAAKRCYRHRICYTGMIRMFSFPSFLIGGVVDSTLLLALAIVLCAFLIEDVTTIVVGVLAADGTIGIPLALASLYIGIALGDTALYAVGSLARSHPRLAHYINHDFTAPFRSWIGHRYALTVFSGHFIPGLRLTTYLASGFFRLPLPVYIPMAIAGGLVLLTALFSVSYWFGSFTTKWGAEVRWGVAALFIAVILFIARRNYLAYRATKKDMPSTNG